MIPLLPRHVFGGLVRLPRKVDSVRVLSTAKCNIVVVGSKDDDCLAELMHLPKDCQIVATGSTLNEIYDEGKGPELEKVIRLEIMFNEDHLLNFAFCIFGRLMCS